MPIGFTRLLADEARTFTIEGPLKSIVFDLFGREVIITESVLVQWLIVVILAVFFFVMGRNLKVVPTSKRQMISEYIVGTFSGQVDSAMGAKYKAYRPYIGALFCFIFTSCIMSIFGLRNPTADVSVTGTWAIITFVLVFYTKFKTGGVKGFLKSYVDPMPFMLPFNIIGDFANPVSQALRLFGNNLSGMVIGGLIYFALGGIAGGLASIGIPAVISLYFDLFSAFIQSYIFITLTMVYVSTADAE